MDDFKDQRFAHIATDVRFKSIPRQQRRIKIDKRFQSMFEDSSFKLKCSVDKRGRPQSSYTASEDLKRFYHISSSSSSSSADESDEKEARPSTPTPRSARRQPIKIPDNNDSESGEESEDDDDNDEPVIDYARGYGNIETSSSDDDDDDSENDGEGDDVEMIHPWGELDENAERTTETATKRLAVCNMDWDQVKAQDIHILLSSFVPPGGVILSIKIYLSDYGRERLSKEDVEGPEELIATSSKKVADADDKDYNRERVRQYQLNRLRYYYAIVDCDSAQTAGALYEKCDGLEYESSASRLDLRFVPDDMRFDDVPHSVMDTAVDVGRYRPQLFTTAALQQSNVRLTWDDTSADRVQVFQRAFNGKDVEEDDDIRAYLASSSSSGNEDDDEDGGGGKHLYAAGENGENNESDSDGDDNDEVDKEAERISKYKALLSGMDNEDAMADDGDVHMEITWGPDLRVQAESIVAKKQLEKEKVEKEPSSWERYLEKRKEKRQRSFKEKLAAKAKATETQPPNEDDNPYSDDELPSDVDLDDPYFKHENDKRKQKKSNMKISANKGDDVEEVDVREKANLELLVMDDDDHKNHFNIKQLLKSDKKSAKKSKRQQHVDADKVHNDDFQMNVNDARFTAVYTSHLFNIDPSEPHFKKTGGMAAMVDEKQRRVTVGVTTPTLKAKRAKLDTVAEENEKNMKKSSEVHRTELSLLVKSVKSKAASFMTKKQKKLSTNR